MRIGSRGSALALWQAEHVRALLQAVHPELVVDIEVIRTTGDKILDVPLAKIGDKGLFTKEIDQALLDGRVDLAVHSLKDVPTRVEPGLLLAAVPQREDPSDVLIVAPGAPSMLAGLPAGARVGTSSLRRRAQLLALRPDLEALDLRGNVETRLEQVAGGKYDAIILAHAGLKRLGLSDRVSQLLTAETGWLPAVGQGALAIICRADDQDTVEKLAALNDAPSANATAAERAFLRELEGGCQVPIAALANADGKTVELTGMVSSLDGTRVLRAETRGTKPEEVGRQLALQMLQRGAAEILEDVRKAMPQTTPAAP